MPSQFIQSARHAVRGIGFVWKEERNFRLHLCGTFVALLTAIIFDFSLLEVSLIIVAILLVLGTEILNTLVEDLLNKVEPNHDPVVGKLKDMMAGIVLINSLGALIIGILTVVHHLRP